MIVDYAINQGSGTSNAYIRATELRAGKPTIYLGGSLETLNNILKNDPHRIRDKRILGFDCWESYLENQCEMIITHESIHIVIFDLTDSIQTCLSFDHADGTYDEISRCFGLGFAVGGKQ